MNILDELRELSFDKDKFQEKVKTLTDEQKQELDWFWESYVSIEWHHYRWYNLYFLCFIKAPWIFGTFAQWKNHNRWVKKWAKWVWLLCPVIDKDTKLVMYFKTIYVFHKDDTDELV